MHYKYDHDKTTRVPPGFCNYPNIISEGIDRCHLTDTTISVELGVFFGMSTYHFDRNIKNKPGFKNHKHFGIDLWHFELPEESLNVIDASCGSYVQSTLIDDVHPYIHFMEEYALPLKLHETTTFIKWDTSRAAMLFDDNTVDFIFIDADHSYDGFKKDVLAWWPKAKPGSLFAGHDIDWPGVRQVMDEMFPNQWIQDGSSWKIYK